MAGASPAATDTVTRPDIVPTSTVPASASPRATRPLPECTRASRTAPTSTRPDPRVTSIAPAAATSTRPGPWGP